ncbi:MAG: response regulator [Elusimicrobiota bacterium]
MKKIMIAEDEWELRNLLKIILEDYDFEIVEAVDGDEAVMVAKEQKPDLIMLDNNMPGLTGYEVIQKLKAIDYLKTTPIVMLTGKRFDAEMQQILKLDVHEFLPKPYEEDKIISTVKKILGDVPKKGVIEEAPVTEITEIAPPPPSISISPSTTTTTIITTTSSESSSPAASPVPEIPTFQRIEKIETIEPQLTKTEFKPPAAGSPSPETSSPPETAVPPETKFYCITKISLKEVIAIMYVSRGTPELGMSVSEPVFVVAHSGEIDMEKFNTFIDVFSDRPLVVIENKTFQEKIKTIAMLGADIFEIDPKAFKKVER